MIPIPTLVLDNIVLALQKGSSQVTYVLFKLLGVPVFMQALSRFSLPGVEIEIAKECSGIRSSLALFITGILASHVFLRSGWRMIVLSLSMIPLAIFKNAVRNCHPLVARSLCGSKFSLRQASPPGRHTVRPLSRSRFLYRCSLCLQESESTLTRMQLKPDSSTNEGNRPRSLKARAK